MKKREVVTRLHGPRTDAGAGFCPVDFPSADWNTVIGAFAPTHARVTEIVSPAKMPDPSEPARLNLLLLGTRDSPKMDVLRAAVKNARLTLPKGTRTKADIENFILANSASFQ